MNKRLQQFLAFENITQSQLADTLGVARASVSHILAGRNKPSFDFIESMAHRFPSLNIEWLITGKGKMFGIDDGNTIPFETEEEIPAPPVQNTPETRQQIIQSPTQSFGYQTVSEARSISKIVVFYNDNTFQELK